MSEQSLTIEDIVSFGFIQVVEPKGKHIYPHKIFMKQCDPEKDIEGKAKFYFITYVFETKHMLITYGKNNIMLSQTLFAGRIETKEELKKILEQTYVL